MHNVGHNHPRVIDTLKEEPDRNGPAMLQSHVSDLAGELAAWLEVAQGLGARAIDDALERAELRRQDLDALFVVSITGVASPSLDARLINLMRLRSDIKRTPIFGVGCMGDALGLTRAADYVLAYPGHAAALLSVEVCSLTIQRDDLSTANLISTGLFGDGAAAVVVTGSARTDGAAQSVAHAGPHILGCRSVFYPDSERHHGLEHFAGWLPHRTFAAIARTHQAQSGRRPRRVSAKLWPCPHRHRQLANSHRRAQGARSYPGRARAASARTGSVVGRWPRTFNGLLAVHVGALQPVAASLDFVGFAWRLLTASPSVGRYYP